MTTQLSLFSAGEVQAMDTARVFKDANEMYRRAPSLFATTAHPKMSERYSFTNTYDILLHMHNRGFVVTSVQSTGKGRFGKVLVRMRHPAYDRRDDVPELVVLDSHDGTSRLKIFLGIVRLICMNGCIAGEGLYSRAFKHLAPDLMYQIMLELDDLQQHVTALDERVSRMKNFKTTVAHRIALADAAIHSRFGDDRSASYVAAMRSNMLRTRRIDDEKDDMYTVMNVIQENVLRGGMHVIQNNSVRRVNSISAVDKTLSINQSLWKCAEELVQQAA